MAEVINELLGVPGIKIYQDYEMFNFSLDSILLANFVSIKKNDKMKVINCDKLSRVEDKGSRMDILVR